MSIGFKKPWAEGQIIWLIIRFIRYEPRPYLITEVNNKWLVLVTLTTSEDKTEEEDATQYVIRHEPPLSRYDGSLVNYDTVLLANHEELIKIMQITYRGQEIRSPYQLLNERDLKLFKYKQNLYFQNSKYQKRLVKIIFAPCALELMPSYLQ